MKAVIKLLGSLYNNNIRACFCAPSPQNVFPFLRGPCHIRDLLPETQLAWGGGGVSKADSSHTA
jgi:hypothetical protein